MLPTVQILTGPLEGMSFAVGEGQSLTLGRSSRNDVVLAHDPWISSSHAVLRHHQRKLVLMDLGSSNGSYMRGKKLSPNCPEEADRYFVVGSTLCKVNTTGRISPGQPLSLYTKEANLFLAQPLIQSARRIARDRSSQCIGAVHLFLAVLEFEQPDVNKFLELLKRDRVELGTRLEKLRIFDGDARWINDFLVYQHKPQDKKECYLTPLVQEVFRERGFSSDFDLVALLKLLLGRTFNILFPLFDLEDSGSLAKRLEQASSATPKPSGKGNLEMILPARFWNALNTELVNGHIVLLTGAMGIGKTTILKQCFNSLLRVDISHFKPDKNYFFDSKFFLVFNEESDLPAYLDSMIGALNTERVIAIDHFGYLLQILEKLGIAGESLIAAINHRTVPVLLGVGRENLPMLETLLEKPAKLHLEDYLEKVTTSTLDRFIKDFEEKTGFTVSAEASEDLAQMLLPNYGFEAIESFLGFCAERLRHFRLLHKELMWRSAHQADKISKAFFHTMLGEWDVPIEADAWRLSQRSRLSSANQTTPGEPISKNPVSAEDAVVWLETVEDVVRKFVSKHFGEPTEMGESWDSADDPGATVRHLEALVSSLDEAFVQWFRIFLKKVDPRTMEAKSALRKNPETFWENHARQFERMNRATARKLFLAIARNIFRDKLRKS